MSITKRKPNYSHQEIILLLREIEKTPELVRCDNNMTANAMKKLWEDISCVVSSISHTRRTGDEIKAKFADLKSRTKQKCSVINKYNRETGGAPPKDLTEVEKTVLTLTGENSNLGLSIFADTSAPVNQIQSETGLCNRRAEIFEYEIMPSTSEETCKSNEICLTNVNIQPSVRQSKPPKRKDPGTEDYDIHYLQIAKETLQTSKDRLSEQKRTNNLLEQLIACVKKQ